MDMSALVSVCVDIYSAAVPIALVFWLAELIVTTFLRAAFGGRLSFNVK